MPDDTVRINCVKDGCGTFPMDRALYRRYKRTGETWHCPAGHPQHFTESTEQKLRERVDKLERQLEAEKDRSNSIWDHVDQLREDLNEQKAKRRSAEARLLEDVDGVIEIAEEEWMWACACGGRGVARFETEARARRGYEQHHEGHSAHAEGETATA